MKPKNIVLLALALVAAVAAYRVVKGPPPLPGATRIREAIDIARKGVEKAELGTIMSSISERYEDGEYDYASLRGMLAFGLRQYQGFQVVVTVDDKEIQVQDAVARVAAQVDAIGISSTGGQVRYQGTLRLLLEREPTKRLLVLPDSRWRVLRVENISELRHTFER